MAAIYEYFSQYAAGKPAGALVSQFSDGQVQVTAQATYARPAAIQTYVQQLAANPTVSRALDDIVTNAELKAAVASYQSFKTGGAFQPDGWRTEVGPAVAKILATEPTGFRQIITSVNHVIESLEQQTSTAAAALASQSSALASASASATSNINGTATTGNGGGLSEAAKIGIGVGVGVGVPVLIAIIVLILVFCCRKGAGVFGIGGSKAAAGAATADGEAGQAMAQAGGPISGSSAPYSGAATSSAAAAAGGATGAGLGYGAGKAAGGTGGYNATNRGLAGNAAPSGASSAGQLGGSSASGSHGLAAAGAGAAAGLAGGYAASKAAAGHSSGQNVSNSATAGQGSTNTAYGSGAQEGSSTAYGRGANTATTTAYSSGSRGLEGVGAGAAAGAAAGIAGGYGASKAAEGLGSGQTASNTATGAQGISSNAYGSSTGGTNGTGYNTGVDGTSSTAHGSGSHGLEAGGVGAAAGLVGGYGASKIASGSSTGQTGNAAGSDTSTAYGYTSSGTQGATSGRSELAGANTAYGKTSGPVGGQTTTGEGYSGKTASGAGASELADSSTLRTADGTPLGQYFAGAGVGAAAGGLAAGAANKSGNSQVANTGSSVSRSAYGNAAAQDSTTASLGQDQTKAVSASTTNGNTLNSSTSKTATGTTNGSTLGGNVSSSAPTNNSNSTSSGLSKTLATGAAAGALGYAGTRAGSANNAQKRQSGTTASTSKPTTGLTQDQAISTNAAPLSSPTEVSSDVAGTAGSKTANVAKGSAFNEDFASGNTNKDGVSALDNGSAANVTSGPASETKSTLTGAQATNTDASELDTSPSSKADDSTTGKRGSLAGIAAGLGFGGLVSSLSKKRGSKADTADVDTSKEADEATSKGIKSSSSKIDSPATGDSSSKNFITESTQDETAPLSSQHKNTSADVDNIEASREIGLKDSQSTAKTNIVAGAPLAGSTYSTWRSETGGAPILQQDTTTAGSVISDKRDLNGSEKSSTVPEISSKVGASTTQPVAGKSTLTERNTVSGTTPSVIHTTSQAGRSTDAASKRDGLVTAPRDAPQLDTQGSGTSRSPDVQSTREAGPQSTVIVPVTPAATSETTADPQKTGNAALRSLDNTSAYGKDSSSRSVTKSLTTSDSVDTRAPLQTQYGSSSNQYWITVNGGKRSVSRGEYEKFIAQQGTSTTRQIVTSDGAQIAGTPSAIESIKRENATTEGTRSTDSSELTEAERIALASSIPIFGLTAGTIGSSAISNKADIKEAKPTEPTTKEMTTMEGIASTQPTSSAEQSMIPKSIGSSKAATPENKDAPIVGATTRASEGPRDVEESVPATTAGKRSSGIFGLGRATTSKKKDVTAEPTASRPDENVPTVSDKETPAPSASKRFSGIFGSSKSISKKSKDIPTDDLAPKKFETVQTAPKKDFTTVTKSADPQAAFESPVIARAVPTSSTVDKGLSGVLASNEQTPTVGKDLPANGSVSKALVAPKASPEGVSDNVTETTKSRTVESGSTAPEKEPSSSAIKRLSGIFGSDKSTNTKAKDTSTNGSTSKQVDKSEAPSGQASNTAAKRFEPQTVESVSAAPGKETSSSSSKNLSGIIGSDNPTTTKTKERSTGGSTSKEADTVQTVPETDPKNASSAKRSSGIFGAALASVGLGSSKSKSPKDTEIPRAVPTNGGTSLGSAPANVDNIPAAPTSSVATTHNPATEPEQPASSTTSKSRLPVSSVSTIETPQYNETSTLRSPDNLSAPTRKTVETSRSVTGATEQAPVSQTIPTASSTVTDKVDINKLQRTSRHDSTVTNQSSSTPSTVYSADQVQSVPSTALGTVTQGDIPIQGRTVALQQLTTPVDSKIVRSIVPTDQEPTTSLTSTTKATDSASVQKEVESKLAATNGKPAVIERGIVTGQPVPTETSTVTPTTKQDTPQSARENTTSLATGATATLPATGSPIVTAPSTIVPSETANPAITEPTQPVPGFVQSAQHVPSSRSLEDTSVIHSGSKQGDMAGRSGAPDASATSSQPNASESIGSDNVTVSQSPAFDVPLSAISTGSKDSALARGLASVSQGKAHHKDATSRKDTPEALAPSTQSEPSSTIGKATTTKSVTPNENVPLSTFNADTPASVPVDDSYNAPQDKPAHSHLEAEQFRSVATDKQSSAGFEVPLSAISTGTEPKNAIETASKASKVSSVPHVDSPEKPAGIDQSVSNVTRDLSTIPEAGNVDATPATGQKKSSESTTTPTTSSLDTSTAMTGLTTVPGSFPGDENLATAQRSAESLSQAPRSSAPIDITNNRASVADTIGSSPSETSPWSPISNTFSVPGDRSSASSDETQPSTAANSPLRLSSYIAGAAGALGMTGIAAAIAGEHEQNKKTSETEQAPKAKDADSAPGESILGSSKAAATLPGSEREILVEANQETKLPTTEAPSVQSTEPVNSSTPAVTELEQGKTASEKQQNQGTKKIETSRNESTLGSVKDISTLPASESTVPVAGNKPSHDFIQKAPSVGSSKPVIPSVPAVTEVEQAMPTTTEQQQTSATKGIETARNDSSFEPSNDSTTVVSDSERGVPVEATQVHQIHTPEAPSKHTSAPTVPSKPTVTELRPGETTVAGNPESSPSSSKAVIDQTAKPTSAPVVPSKPTVTELQPGETLIARESDSSPPSSESVTKIIAEPKSAPLVLTPEAPAVESSKATLPSLADVTEVYPGSAKSAPSSSKAVTGQIDEPNSAPTVLDPETRSKEGSKSIVSSKSNVTGLQPGKILGTTGSESLPTSSKLTSSQVVETSYVPKLETDPFAFYGKTSFGSTQSASSNPVDLAPASTDRVTATSSGTNSAPRVDSVTEYKPEAFEGGSVATTVGTKDNEVTKSDKSTAPLPEQPTSATTQLDPSGQVPGSAATNAKSTSPSAPAQTIQVEHFESSTSESSGVATWKAIQPDSYKTNEATNVINPSAETAELQKTLVSKSIEQHIASGSTTTNTSAQAVKIDHYESTSPEATGLATWKVVNPNESNSPATEPKENVTVRGAGETGTTIKKLAQGIESGELELKSREIITTDESGNVTAPASTKSVQQQPASFESHKALVPEDQEETTATKTTIHNEQRDQAPVEHTVVSSDNANASGIDTKEIVDSTSATQEDVNLKHLKSSLPKSEYEQLTAGTRQVLTSDKQSGGETILHGSSNLAPEFMDQQSLSLSTREVILPEGQSKFDITQLRAILSSSELSRVARGWYTIVVTGVQRKLVIDTEREEESYYWQDLHNNVNMDEFKLDIDKAPIGSTTDTFYLMVNGQKRTVSRAEYEQFLAQHSTSSTKTESRGIVGDVTAVASDTAATISNAANNATAGAAESVTAGAEAGSGYFSRLYHLVVDGQQHSVSQDEHEKHLGEQGSSTSSTTQTREVVDNATTTLSDAATSASSAALTTASGVAAGAASTAEAGSGYLSGLYHIVVDGVRRNVSQDEYEKHVSEQGSLTTSTQARDIVSSAGATASHAATATGSAASAAASGIAAGAASTAETSTGYLSGLYHIVVDGVKRNVSQEEYEKHASEQATTTTSTQARDVVGSATTTLSDIATTTGSAASTAASGVATSAASTAQSSGGFLSGLYHVIVDGVQRQVTPDEHEQIVASQQTQLGTKEIVSSGTTTTDSLPNVSSSETYYIVIDGKKKAVSKAEYERFVLENNSTSGSRQVFSTDSKAVSDVEGVTFEDVGTAADTFYISIDGVKRSVSKAEYEKFVSAQNAPVESRQMITSDNQSTTSALDTYYLVVDGVKKSVSRTEYEQFIASQKEGTVSTSSSAPVVKAGPGKSESTYTIVIDGEKRSVSKAEYDAFVAQNEGNSTFGKKDLVRDSGSGSSETFYLSIDGVKRAVTKDEFDAFVAQNEGAVTSEERRDVTRNTSSGSSETFYIIVDGVKRAASKAEYEEFLASNKNVSVISEPTTSSQTYYIEINGEKRTVSKAEYEAFIASNKEAAVISEPSTTSGTYQIELNGEKRTVSKAEYEAFLSGNKNVFVTPGPSTSSGSYYIEINGEKRSVSKAEYESFIASNKDAAIVAEPSSSSETYYLEINGEKRAVSKADYEAFVANNKSVTTSSQHSGPSSSESYWIEINGTKRAVSKAEYEAFIAGQGNSLTTTSLSSEMRPLSVADLAAQLRNAEDSADDSSEVREIVTSGADGDTLIKKVVVSSGGSGWASEEAAVMDDEFRSSSQERKAPWESNDGPSVEDGNSWKSGGPSLFG